MVVSQSHALISSLSSQFFEECLFVFESRVFFILPHINFRCKDFLTPFESLMYMISPFPRVVYSNYSNLVERKENIEKT